MTYTGRTAAPTKAAKETAEGEFLEMQLSKKREPSVDDYLELAGLKTGALFGAAAASGGIRKEKAGGSCQVPEDALQPPRLRHQSGTRKRITSYFTLWTALA